MNRWILTITALFIIVFLTWGCGKDNKSVNSNGSVIQPEESSVEESKPEGQNTQIPPQEVDPIKMQIDNMTLDEKIGQMVIFGVDGQTLSSTTIKMIDEYHVGGFIILSENVYDAKQLLNLMNSLKGANSRVNKIPLFLSVDQEGGRVDRMPAPIRKLPSNRKVASVYSAGSSYKIGNIISEELDAFGFNMDFAPVLDINSNPKNPVIGDRSYGSNADIVTDLGIQTMKGIRDRGIIPVIKHFPGHGDTLVDSHVGLPSVNKDMDMLRNFELVPFARAIKEGADAVMIAHILLPKLDPKYPASMSKAVITDILRGDLNFDGVVITDDITMGAIVKNYNVGDAAVVSVNAGSDIILVGHGSDNQVSVIRALKNAVEGGTINEERVDESVYRILKLKQKYNISDKIVESIDVAKINEKINSVLNSE